MRLFLSILAIWLTNVRRYNLVGVKKIPPPARADLNSAEGLIFKAETRLIDAVRFSPHHTRGSVADLSW